LPQARRNPATREHRSAPPNCSSRVPWGRSRAMRDFDAPRCRGASRASLSPITLEHIALGYGKFTSPPLPHVAALTVVRRCRGTARRDVTALGVPRSATLLFSPRHLGNVKFRPTDLIYDVVVRTRSDDGRGHFGRALAACAPREPIALG